MTKSLIQKLRDAASGSRDLDLAVFNAVSEHEWRFAAHTKLCITYDRYGPGAVGNPLCSLSQITTSLDAIIGLIEEKLPGWKWSINQLDYGCNCFVKPPLKTMGDIELQGLGEGGAHSSAPIALCLALLSALEGETDG